MTKILCYKTVHAREKHFTFAPNEGTCRYPIYPGTCVPVQSYLTLCDPMDCSPPGSSVHGILQASILEWVAISYSRVIFPTQGWNLRLLRLLHWKANSLPLAPPGKPHLSWYSTSFIESMNHLLIRCKTS